MPNRSRRSAADRAEARRRARLAARGDEIDQANEEEEESAAGQSGGGGSLLSRLFPAAPPLPGRPDPMQGFTYSGPLPGVVGALYVLLRNPLPWLIGGALWATSQFFRSNDIYGVIALFASFGGLIGAGWFGWQRPWLFGLAAGVVGWLPLVVIWIALGGPSTAVVTASPTPSVQVASPSASVAPSLVESPAASAAPSAVASVEPTPAPSGDGTTTSAGSLAAALVTELIFQAGLGAFAGFYGGYLRRRSAATSGSSAPRNRRRR